MNCPKCYEPLRIADRQGIEIDYCPECRGVWLDRGELGKIIERTLRLDSPSPSYENHPGHGTYEGRPKYPGSYEDRHYKKREKFYKKKFTKKKKAKHVIEDLFDFFD